MDFSGINNVGDIKKISFEVLDNEYMFGILEHGNPATPNDTLLTNYFCDYYSFGTAADADPYGAASGDACQTTEHEHIHDGGKDRIDKEPC